VTPPLGPVAQVDRAGAGVEHQRPGLEQGRVSAGVLRRVERPFGDGDVPGRSDEVAELGDGYRVVFYPEAVDLDAADGALFG
jgi:hypothetical protein